MLLTVTTTALGRQHPLLDWLTAIDPPVELAAPLLDVPTYSQYVAIAREKGWTPADPVEKLAITIENYAKVLIETNW